MSDIEELVDDNKKLTYWIVMNNLDKYTVKIKQFITKEGMPIAKAGVKALYETHGGGNY